MCVVVGCASAPVVKSKPAVVNQPPAAAGERWIAVGLGYESLDGGGLAIAKLGGRGVVTVAKELPGGQFGWIDERTLLVVDPGEHDTRISRYVDGARLDERILTERDWPHQDFVEAEITRDGEVWLSRCVLDGNECDGQRVHRRIYPTPSDDQDHAPDGLEVGRVDDHDDDPWPLPPTVSAPPGMTIATAQVDVEMDDPMGGASTHAQVAGVVCTAHGARVTYPQSEWASMWGPDDSTRTARWVSRDPPIFEIAEDSVNPAGYHHVHRSYARPCEPAFDGFAWLGDDRWASFALRRHDPPYGTGPGEPPDLEGEWTFHAGTTVIGTLHGVAQLRANVPAP